MLNSQRRRTAVRFHRNSLALAAASLLGPWAAAPAIAVDYVWDGGGTYNGSIGPNVIGATDTLAISGGGIIWAGYPLSTLSGAVVTWSGGDIGLQSGVSVNNAGLWNATSAGLMRLYDAGYGGTFTNASTGVLQNSGPGTLRVDAAGSFSFVNDGGTLSASAGAIQFNSDSWTKVVFGDGSHFTGAGTIAVGGNGATFVGTQNVAAGASLVLNASGGYFVGSGSGAKLAGQAQWTSGNVYGTWEVGAGSVLAANTGDAKNLVNAGLTNNGTIAWGTIDALGFSSGSTLTNNGNFIASAATTLADAGYGGTFVNNGLFQSAGAGTVSVNALGSFIFQNGGSGTVDARDAGDKVQFNSDSYGKVVFADGSHFTGAGTIAIGGNGATFVGAQNVAAGTSLVLDSSGYFNGSGAKLVGAAQWASGSFYGSWEVGAGSVLTANSGAAKNLNSAGLTNNGTIAWATADALGFQNGSTLTNNGSFVATAATTLVDASYGGNFVNNGLFQSAGAGTVTVKAFGSFAFQNGGSGTVDARDAGDTVQFNSDNWTKVTFADGSHFTGAGTIAIGGNGANFTGTQHVAAGTALVLNSSGYFNGSGAKLAGAAQWTSGSFYGTWEVASGSVLTANSGDAKNLNTAALANNGTIVWATTDALGFQNGSTLTNNGNFVATAATTLADASYGGTFVNNGLFRSAGAGTVSVNALGSFSFQNGGSGKVDARDAGDKVQFNSDSYGKVMFADGSRFTGAGTIAIGGNGATFTGTQHVAGGTALVLDSSGYFHGSGSGAKLAGKAQWKSGSFYGTWEVGSGSELKAKGGAAAKNLNTAGLTNNGTIVWATTDALGFQNGSTLTNNGKFDMTADGSLVDASYGGNFVNHGMFQKTGGSGTTSIAANGSFGFQNAADGVVQALSGTIALGSFTNQGMIAGNAGYSGALVNAGHVMPGKAGGAPAALALDGSFAQTAAGFFDVGLAGTAFGQLNVTGSALLDGTITMICLGSCNYAVGTRWEVLSAGGGVSGTFAGAVAMIGFSAGAFSVDYSNPKGLWVEVTSATVGVVPEPSTYALMLGGLGLIAAWARRQARRRA